MMSGSPEMLFPDDMDDSPRPTRPREIAQPIARRSSAVAPSDRRMVFSPGVPPRGFRAEKVAIPAKPFVPISRPSSFPGFYDPTGRIERRKSAFSLNVDSEVKSPLRRTKKAGRRRSTRRGVRAIRSRKVSRPSTRRFLRR